MKVERYNDALIAFARSFSDFTDSMTNEGFFIGEEYEKLYEYACDRDVMESIESWLEKGHIVTPHGSDLGLIENTANSVSFWFCFEPDSYLRIRFTCKALVQLPLEVFNDEEVDADRAWKELDRLCRGV